MQSPLFVIRLLVNPGIEFAYRWQALAAERQQKREKRVQELPLVMRGERFMAPYKLFVFLNGQSVGEIERHSGEETTDHKHMKFGCPHCGQAGGVRWLGEGEDRSVVRLSGGFHVEEGRHPEAKYVIICDTCDEIDPPRII